EKPPPSCRQIIGAPAISGAYEESVCLPQRERVPVPCVREFVFQIFRSRFDDPFPGRFAKESSERKCQHEDPNELSRSTHCPRTGGGDTRCTERSFSRLPVRPSN